LTGNCVAGSATQGSVTIFGEAEVVAVEAEAFVAAASPAPLLLKDEPEWSVHWGNLDFRRCVCVTNLTPLSLKILDLEAVVACPRIEGFPTSRLADCIMSDVTEAGFMEPRPKALKIGFNVRKDGLRKGVYYPKNGKGKFRGEVRMGKLGKFWLGRECLLEAMMLKKDISHKCVGNETLHFDHADYFRFFKYEGVVYDDKSKIKEFLKQAAVSPEAKAAKAAFKKFMKGELKRIMGLPVIKSYLNKPKSAPRREEESPTQAGAAHSGSSQPASMVCLETHIQSPPGKSLPPLDRSDAVLGSLDGQQVHRKELQPMPEISLENFSLSPSFDLCCNDWDAMPMERENWTGVQTSSPSNHLELSYEQILSDLDMSQTE